MTTTLIENAPSQSGVVRHALSVAWGAISGVAPHVLHHVGPLAGAAIFAGVGGQVLFFVLGLAVATPMLLRLYRRFRTWLAPAIAAGIFAIAFLLSSVFLGPLITGSDTASAAAGSPIVTTTVDHHGH